MVIWELAILTAYLIFLIFLHSTLNCLFCKGRNHPSNRTRKSELSVCSKLLSPRPQLSPELHVYFRNWMVIEIFTPSFLVKDEDFCSRNRKLIFLSVWNLLSIRKAGHKQWCHRDVETTPPICDRRLTPVYARASAILTVNAWYNVTDKTFCVHYVFKSTEG